MALEWLQQRRTPLHGPLLAHGGAALSQKHCNILGPIEFSMRVEETPDDPVNATRVRLKPVSHVVDTANQL